MKQAFLTLFFLLNIQSVPDEHCLKKELGSPFDISTCSLCQYSFYNEIIKKCDTNIPKKVNECECYETNTEKTLYCKRCQRGYFYNKFSNTCDKCLVQNCISCNSDQRCYACIGGDIPDLNPDKADSKKEEDKYKCYGGRETPENCLIAYGLDFIGKCFQCKDGFAMNNDQELICVASTTGCRIASLNNPLKCSECLTSHYISEDGTCERHFPVSIVWILTIIIILGFAIGLSIMRCIVQKIEDQREDAIDNYEAL